MSKLTFDWLKTVQSRVSVQTMTLTPRAISQSDRCFVIIPGNPGCIKFYEQFATVTGEGTGLVVKGVSHTAHAKCPGGPDHSHPELGECGLEAQVRHKVEYLRGEIFPKYERVVLIGHSIGCYMILHLMDLLQEDERAKVAKCMLMFPTIERMRATPNGRKLTPLLTHARWVFPFVAYSVSYLPDPLLNYTLSFFVKKKPDYCCHDIVKRNLLTPQVANSVTFLALEEMLQVVERDDDLISRHAEKLIIYYGNKDPWCTADMYEEVSKLHGDAAQVHLCQRDIEHAFVLGHSVETADMVIGWTKEIFN